MDKLREELFLNPHWCKLTASETRRGARFGDLDSVALANLRARKLLVKCHRVKWRLQKVSACYEAIARLSLGEFASRVLKILDSDGVALTNALETVLVRLEAMEFGNLAEASGAGSFEDGVIRYQKYREARGERIRLEAKTPKWKWQRDETGKLLPVIGNEGGVFRDYYAMQSCTSGRCAFITGMEPVRVGLTVPQLPGSPAWLRPGTPTIAKVLLNQGYTTAEFGKNHLGDHAESLPTAQGFQEYWGYLYHLDAMQQVSFPDINKSTTEQTVAPPGLNTPIEGLTPPPGSVDARTQIALIPPRPILSCTSSDGTLKNQKVESAAADAGALEDHRRGDLGQGDRLARRQRSQEDGQAVLLLVQSGAHACHHRALAEVRGHDR